MHGHESAAVVYRRKHHRAWDICQVKRTYRILLVLLLPVCVAAALRLPLLEIRPMHADEAVQTAIFRDLWQQGRYVYNPREFHGPTLPYATLPSAALSGARNYADTNEETYRLVPVLFGIGVVALLFLLVDTLGITAVTAAALLAAVSPAMVYYSRYYIHETLLVFFSLGAIVCGWRYVVSRRVLWCILAGACVGCMQSTKETAAIAYLAAGFATCSTFLWTRLRDTCDDQPAERGGAGRWKWQHLAAGIATAVAVTILLLSSFFTNMRGPVDGVLTYLTWLGRAGGDSPHVHSWSFYFHRLLWWRVGQGSIWSEGLIMLLAAAGLVRALTARRTSAADNSVLLIRWLAGYTICITAIYCVIPYKTPWCLLQFLLGMILMAGVGAGLLVQSVRFLPLRVIIAALLVAGAGHLGWQAYRAGFVVPADVGNPYVYAHTSPDVMRLAGYLQTLVEVSPRHEKTPVKVIWTDAYYWPLPWYLRRFEHVELWRSMPADPQAPIVMAAPQYNAQLEAMLGRDYAMVIHELRPQVFVALWVDFDLWEKCLRHMGRIE